MLDSGYLIAVESLVQRHQEAPKFKDDTTLYSFQNSYFWPTKNWAPSDVDYAIYLLKKAGPKSSDLMHPTEKERFAKFKTTLASQWSAIQEGVVKHEDVLKQMSTDDRKMFLLREAAFWDFHRPISNRTGMGEIEERQKAMDKNSMTDHEFEATLNTNQLLAHLEKRLYTLQVVSASNQLKVSVVCKTLMNRSEVWRPLDPFINKTLINPYVTDIDTFTAVRTKPTGDEIRAWCNSLQNLLADPLGVAKFTEFLKQEFTSENLAFYLDCRELDNEYARVKWVAKAREIYRKYIVVGSPAEINITAQLRKTLIDKFQPFDAKEVLRGDEVKCDVFLDTIAHVFTLMENNSYTRFIVSIMKNGYA
jgi:hypothetical protein